MILTYLTHTHLQNLKGTVVNQMYNSVNKGSLKITFTILNAYWKLKYLIWPDKKKLKFCLNFKTFYCL